MAFLIVIVVVGALVATLVVVGVKRHAEHLGELRHYDKHKRRR